jgi:hypothetical protein
MGGRHKRLGLTGPAGLLVAGWLGVLVSVIVAQVPPGWEIIQITDDPYYDGVPAINDCGQIAFQKRLGDDWPASEIFVWDNGTIIRITDDNVGDGPPDIADDGTIAWSRKSGPNNTLEIVIYRDGILAPLTNNEVDDLAANINNLGHIAWNSYNGTGCAGSDIHFFDGSSIEQLTDNAYSNQSPIMNDFDHTTWTQYNFCVSPWVSTIMLGDPGPTHMLTDGLTRAAGGRINNLEQITWQGETGVALWESGTTVELTDWGSNPDINDLGLVVFSRWHEDILAYQIWTWRAGLLRRITLEGVWNLTGRINNSSEIVWQRGYFPNVDLLLLTWTTGNADRDEDGDVDLPDASLVLSCIAYPPTSADPCRCHRADLNHDNTTDFRDFALLQINFTGAH